MHPREQKTGTGEAPVGPPRFATAIYRPMDGHGEYLATIVGRRPDGSLDLEVDLPGGMFLSRIKVGTAPGECRV